MERHFGAAEPLYRGVGTSVLHSLALAILMGCSPIYIQGVELPLEKKNYVYHQSWRGGAWMICRALKAQLQEWLTGRPEYSDFFAAINETLASFTRLVELCHNEGRGIYNLSSTSNLNRISSLPYLSPEEVVKRGVLR